MGFGETLEEATLNHDHHLELFLRRCTQRNLKLNNKKVKLRTQEVPFIGHIATADGLCVDPHKIQAIREMPKPADVAAVQSLLGLSQYLTLGACARGLQYLVCVFVCVCVCVCVCYQFAGSISSPYNTFSTAIGFSLGLSDFQLTDLSKMPSFLRKSGYFVVSNPHKRLCILHVL